MLTKEMYKKALGVARKNSRTLQDAEDFLQDACLTLVSKPSSSIQYLNKYIYNAIADYITMQKYQKRTGYVVPLEGIKNIAAEFDMHDIIITNRIRQLVVDFLADPRYLKLHKMQRLIIRCSITGETVPNVNLVSHRKYAFKHLTGYLANKGVI